MRQERAGNGSPKQEPGKTNLRLRSLTALSVLAAAATAVGAAFAGSSSSAATPKSSFSGSSSSGGTPTSSFSGSGTSGGSGEGDGGFGSDDSGSSEQEGGGGTLGAATFGPAGATGMTVSAVRRLQTSLARLGYFHHAVTGYYGLVTTAAVQQFQRSAGLKPDGIWGSHSQTALKKRLAGR